MQKPAQDALPCRRWAIRLGEERGDRQCILRFPALVVLCRHARVPHFILRMHVAEPQIASYAMDASRKSGRQLPMGIALTSAVGLIPGFGFPENSCTPRER